MNQQFKTFHDHWRFNTNNPRSSLWPLPHKTRRIKAGFLDDEQLAISRLYTSQRVVLSWTCLRNVPGYKCMMSDAFKTIHELVRRSSRKPPARIGDVDTMVGPNGLDTRAYRATMHKIIILSVRLGGFKAMAMRR